MDFEVNKLNPPKPPTAKYFRLACAVGRYLNGIHGFFILHGEGEPVHPGESEAFWATEHWPAR
jgi:hypothetical protein